MKLEGKVVIVTGGASGIGRDTAVLMAKEGAKVVVAGRSKEKLAAVEQEIVEAGGQCTTFSGDLTSETANKDLVSHAVEKYGAVHAAFINAGVYKPCNLAEVTDADLDETFGANFKSAVFALKHLGPAMKETAGGKGSIILNTSAMSTAVKTTLTAGWLYSCAKAAAKMLMTYAAITFAESEVRVNAVAPGVVSTPILGGMPEEQLNGFASTVHLFPKRAGVPREIASFVTLLASDEGALANGQEFVVDAGFSVC
mmetsp:Transcript_11609/g.28273  ORF Transcript_11609/g.28273 Transcript_11609/m.28273 type:complete len:255 (+) Transcript_11609:170-934(+)